MYIQEYRPKTFSEVRGQSLPLKVLKYIAKNPDNVCRSIILSGERGTGKTTCARIFAKAVNNPKRTGDADLENEFCNSIVRGSTLYQEYDSAIVGNVESIRSLRETFAFSITKGYRVILFDEIQESSPQAQAALLTVLEECPKGTFFLFATTNPEKLLPTIISRSIKLDFKTIDENELVDHLKSICEKESIDYTEDVLHMIARRTSGHARDSVNQLEMLKILGVEEYKRDYRYLLSDIQEFFSLVQIDKVKASNKAIQILSNPLLFVEQDFEVYMKSLADKVYVEGADVPYGKEIIKIWLKSHRFLETTNDWYILLMSFSSLFVKKQTVTNRFGR